MSGVSTLIGASTRRNDRHNNRRIIGTLTLDYQDRKIARKNGWVFEYGSICDYLQFSFVNLDYAEVRLISKEVNRLSMRQNIYMSDLYGDPSEDRVFIIRLSSESKFFGCKHAQEKIGNMISKGLIPAIYVTSKAVNKCLSFQTANKNPKESAISVLKVDITGVSAEYANDTRQTGGRKDGNKVNQKITFSSIPDNDDWTL